MDTNDEDTNDEDIDTLQQAKNALLDVVWANEKTKRFPDEIHKELVELEARVGALIEKVAGKF